MTMRAPWRSAAGVAAVLMLLGGCGDDGEVASDEDVREEQTEPEQDAGVDAEGYCDAARELDDQESFPTSEQLDQLVAVAPEEIKDDVDFVVERFKASIEAGDPARAFADPEVEQRLDRVEEFEVRECDLGGQEEEEQQDPSVTELE